MPSLAEKSVLITGASSGIGAYLARELVRRGARVGLVARREEKLEALAEELRAAGGRAAWARADVLDGEDLTRALDAVTVELAGADVVVANAGYAWPEPPHRFVPGAALQMYDVNLFGMLRLIDWALPRFLATGKGHIVGIASAASFAGLKDNAAYCDSKAAMRIHLQALRTSLKGRGIAVTTICPGFVKSELTAEVKFPMPFLWETDRAARTIATAIEKRRGEVLFPWQLLLLKQVMMRLLPVAALEAVIRRSAPDRP